jgi:hypothetical protein
MSAKSEPSPPTQWIPTWLANEASDLEKSKQASVVSSSKIFLKYRLHGSSLDQ